MTAINFAAAIRHSGLVAPREQLKAELAHQQAELTTAEADLARCRSRHLTEAGGGIVVDGAAGVGSG